MSESVSLGKRISKSKAYYCGSKRRKFGSGPRPLSTGVQGILITTGDKEKFCVSEAYNLLNEYADELYGPENKPLDSSSSESDKEVASEEGSDERERRFCSLNSGAKHVVFIRCSDEINPTKLVHSMLSDIYNSQVKKSRFCQRILPVSRVCYASLDDIKKCVVGVLEPHFHSNTTDSHTFAINYKCRNNSSIKREDVIRVVASMVTMEDEFPHRVNFDDPELIIIVEIIKNLCCLGVVRDFNKLRKYNIHSLTEPLPDPKPAKPEDNTSTHKSTKGLESTKTVSSHASEHKESTMVGDELSLDQEEKGKVFEESGDIIEKKFD